MHLGATLRLLRVGSGLSLRALAGRLRVSSAYLSRVENGIDAVPTVSRLSAIARELDVPEQLLIDAAHQLSPYVLRYAEAEPQAASLFLEIARRGLAPHELEEVQAFIARRFSRTPPKDRDANVALAPLLAPSRVILGFDGPDIGEALEIAGGRFEATGLAHARTAAAFRSAHESMPSAIGAGVSVPNVTVPGAETQAALVTLKGTSATAGPDGLPVSVLVLLLGGRAGAPHLARVAHVARLAARGLASELRVVRRPEEAISRIEALERVR